MPFVIVFLIIAGAAIIAWLYPHLRAVALGVLALFVVLFAVSYFITGSQTAREARLITPDELVLSHLDFADDPMAGRLSGNVFNGSDSHRLRSLDLRVTLHDCPDEASELSDCVIVADATGTSRVDVPPGQMRRFEVVLRFPDRPASDGILKWQHEVVGTRATE
jgi:hypothetical protein